ncbi:hypothetical protein ABZ400_35605 [Streptomyces sp. NPDC005897]|uniref:hypothetical protein n=1 Tax=Streptomyces sp. NPDC005897 TaxID=3157081 RepID=UPI003405146F
MGPLYPVLTAMLRRDPLRRPDAAEAKRLLETVTGDGQRPSRSPGDAVTGQRPRRWPRRAAALGAGAVLTLGLVVAHDGGAGKTAPPPVRSRPAQETPGGDAGVLVGDPHTADVCALADPAALDRFGDEEAHVDVDYGNFDRCDVLVGIDGSTRIDVSIRVLPGPSPEGSQPSRTVGRIDIREEQAEHNECELLLTSDGDTDAQVAVRVNMGKGSVAGGNATLCTVADRAAASAAKVLNRGPLPRRSPSYPRTSLAWADACALLDTRALSVVPGLEVDVPDIGVANWSCTWSSGADDLDAKIAFFRDQPKSAVHGGTAATLSGFRSLVEPSDEDTCTAFVEYRRYSGLDAETAAEMVRIDVAGQRPMDKLCAMTGDLAASAAAELRTR